VIEGLGAPSQYLHVLLRHRPFSIARCHSAAARARQEDLSLAELAELIEQLPQIDWSPAIEAVARAERQRAAAFA
jgi:hypothetical protein